MRKKHRNVSRHLSFCTSDAHGPIFIFHMEKAGDWREDVLRITVRTLAIRFIDLALMLVLS